MNLTVDQIHNIHFEITNKCNSRCPGCARTLSGDTHPYLKSQLTEWDIESFRNILPADIIKGKSFTLGGTVDEPFMNKDIVHIVEYLIKHGAHVEIFTNGGANTKHTFEHLGKLSADTDQLDIKFSVDGLEDTNHLYRVNVDWSKVLENMTAYSSKGGVCEWQYLVFEHNEHDINKAKQLAATLKIPFYIRQNVRNIKPWTSYIKKKINGVVTTEEFVVNPTQNKDLSHPETEKVSKWKLPENISEQEKADSIQCLMYHKKEIFIDWSGLVWPCCWFATDYHFENDPVFAEIENEFGKNWNNIKHHSLQDILVHPYYTELLVKSWIKNAKFHNQECFKKCGDFAKRQSYKFTSV